MVATFWPVYVYCRFMILMATSWPDGCHVSSARTTCTLRHLGCAYSFDGWAWELLQPKQEAALKAGSRTRCLHRDLQAGTLAVARTMIAEEHQHPRLQSKDTEAVMALSNEQQFRSGDVQLASREPADAPTAVRSYLSRCAFP